MTPKVKGKIAEDLFQKWMDAQGILFFSIDQRISTQSKAIKVKIGSKRPDFVIWIPKTGLLLVDVKNYKTSIEVEKNGFKISAVDVNKYINLEKNLLSRVWIVFYSKVAESVSWYWINAADIREKCEEEKSFQNFKGKSIFTGNKFFVPCDECIEVKDTESFQAFISKVLLV